MEFVNSRPGPTRIEAQAARLVARYFRAAGVDGGAAERLAAQVLEPVLRHVPRDDHFLALSVTLAHAFLMDSANRNLMRNDLAGDAGVGSSLVCDARIPGREGVLVGRFRRLNAVPPMQRSHMVSSRVRGGRRAGWAEMQASLRLATIRTWYVFSVALLVWPG